MMGVRYRLYRSLTMLAPSGYRQHLGELLSYTKNEQSTDYWIGSSLIISMLIFSIVVLLHKLFFPDAVSIDTRYINLSFSSAYIIIALVSILAVQLLVYLIVYLKAADKTRRIEESLPDMLQIISSNLRAGMTPFQAMKLAARKEFGPLKEEIEIATNKSLGMTSFGKALLDMSRRSRSSLLERSMKLFVTSIRSGGQLAQLLEDLANDIAETRSLKKDLVANTKMYSMLIIFIVGFGAPLLLSVSIQFIKIITNMQSSSNISDAEFGMSFLAGTVSITPDFIFMLSVIIIFVTSLLASILTGVISEGDEKQGLKYAPLIITFSFIIFALSRFVMDAFLKI